MRTQATTPNMMRWKPALGRMEALREVRNCADLKLAETMLAEAVSNLSLKDMCWTGLITSRPIEVQCSRSTSSNKKKPDDHFGTVEARRTCGF